MKSEDIQEMLNKVEYTQKMLIIKKEFYEEHKEEINDLIRDNWLLDLVITNMLDADAIVMDKKIFYGIE